MSVEEWRPIPGYDGNEVSDQGNVRSWLVPQSRTHEWLAEPELLSISFRPDGYPSVALRGGGRRPRWCVHQLVALAFIGPRPDGLEVRHLNGIPTDCRPSNLKYGTRSENMLDRVLHGTHHHTRKTHCVNGHPFDAKNTRITLGSSGRPRRKCRACVVLSKQRSKARRAGLVAAS